ncbi:hypothetical protein CHH28_08425 [Bacterioplanes sanyensis]|uniref:Thioredoxin domain-containing protein n=1 Tax=Bacterioplanes sanyensis TaxID=1249553 RepID=A0A222FJN4_9GAMM|nr:TlpA disulfide reductase family protein [Bacterioplanes sanyensis]ASP38704.1 hypothetical protein CHH28_08425 [Bacterioplanes sanyensis]
MRMYSMMSSVNSWVLALTLTSGVAMAAPQAGDAAPDFKATTIDGEVFDLSDYRGKQPVYLKFWATWCSYCKAEMPHLKHIREQYDDLVVMTVNIGLNDSVSNINQLYQQQGYGLPTVFDSDGKLTRLYGVVGTPHSVLIDRHGDIVLRTFQAGDQLDQMLKQVNQPLMSRTDRLRAQR